MLSPTRRLHAGQGAAQPCSPSMYNTHMPGVRLWFLSEVALLPSRSCPPSQIAWEVKVHETSKSTRVCVGFTAAQGLGCDSASSRDLWMYHAHTG